MLRELLRALADALTVEVGEHVWVRVARDRDPGALDLAEVVELGELPRRRPLQRLLVAVDQQLPPNELVGVLKALT